MSVYKDGEPCKHPGCLHHITHPCEECGRIAGRYDYAALLARHNALKEAVKWMLYIDTPENFDGGKHIAARAEVDRLLGES